MKGHVFVLVLSLCGIASTMANSSQELQFNSPSLTIRMDGLTGGIQSIVNQKDVYGMNWILRSDSSQYPWQTSKLAWGLGFVEIDGKMNRWNHPTIRKSAQTAFLTYTMDGLVLHVERSLTKDGRLFERYRFKNTSGRTLHLRKMGIYTPFNDNYPDAKTCVTSRCNAHIWAEGSASYVFAQRMGGDAPHLGLVLTQGALESYEVLNRNRNVYDWALSGSNVRGTIVLNPTDCTLEPGRSTELSWVVFPAENWADFYREAETVGFVKVSSERFVLEGNQTIEVCFESKKLLKPITCSVNGEQVPFKVVGDNVMVNAIPNKLGDQVVRMDYGKGKYAVAKLFRFSNIDDLLNKRARFIVQKQQMNEPDDPRNGAYMVYDNEKGCIYKNNDARRSSDVNEARERVGMGVFLAKYLQGHRDTLLRASLDRYVAFIRTKLQRSDYSIPSAIDGSGHMRVYNYPWVARLYLERYRIDGDTSFLTLYYRTIRRYFVDSKRGFYAIGVPAKMGLDELRKAGRMAEADSLLADYKLTAAKFLQNSIFYPKSEVNYEQSIVAPSVIFLLEMYQITKEAPYLAEAEKQLKALESFGGDQPDYHLNNIAIRHWDGYWFGKYEFWGDIMPHYWSTITSEAYWRYAQVTGKPDYLKRAEIIVRNNLSSFFEDGSASCAYVYPARVNGRKATLYDPFANDQDWALVYYLDFLSADQPSMHHEN